MEYIKNRISEDDLNNVINYIDTKYRDSLTLIQNILNEINSVQTTIIDLQTIITQINNTIPSDLANTINNLGTEYDFKDGITDSLSNRTRVANSTLLYELGYLTGDYIKNKIGQKQVYQVYVSPITGNDTNIGTRELPVARLSRALELCINYDRAIIEISDTGTEELQGILTLEKGKNLEVFCNTEYYDFSFGIIGNLKSKLMILDYDKVVFKNIRFKQTNFDAATQPLSLENAVFFFDSCYIQFINCEFEYIGSVQIPWIYAKNSKIIIDNCIFPDTNGNTIFLNSSDNYPNEIININSYIGNTTNLTDGNQRIEVK